MAVIQKVEQNICSLLRFLLHPLWNTMNTLHCTCTTSVTMILTTGTIILIESYNMTTNWSLKPSWHSILFTHFVVQWYVLGLEQINRSKSCLKLDFKYNRRKNCSNRTIGCRDMVNKFSKVHIIRMRLRMYLIRKLTLTEILPHTPVNR